MLNLVYRILGGSRTPAGVTANPFDTPVGSGGSLKTLRQCRSLAPCLLNRTEQVRAVRRCLEERQNAGPPVEPLLVILRAMQDDMHELFVDRIGSIELKRLLDEAPVHYKRGVKWPKETAVTAILSELASHFGWDKIGQPDHQLPSSICFQLTLYASRWSETAEALATQWIEYVASDWPSDPNGHFTVAFLSALSEGDPRKPGSPTPSSQKLEAFINEVGCQYGRSDRILVLNPLPFIEWPDFQDWLDELYDELRDTDLNLKLSSLKSHLFKADGPVRLCQIHDAVHAHFAGQGDRVYEGR